MFDYQQLIDSLIKGEKEIVNNLVKQAVDEGLSAKDVLDNGLIAGMNVVGDKMEAGDMFIPEVLMAAQIMGEGVNFLKPLLRDDQSAAKGKVIIGTVKGDLHDIGKNLVAMMCEGSGLEVINLGVDIAPEQFADAAKENNADIVCLSALLTTTMPQMKKTIEAIKDNGLNNRVKVLIGGAPVTQAFADEIGADAFAADAGSAAKKANQLLSVSA
ncbi:MAG: corrinoid protein [Desulfobacterales bacterium]|nr:corrinoid protein [Desulfobacterales bacterium]